MLNYYVTFLQLLRKCQILVLLRVLLLLLLFFSKYFVFKVDNILYDLEFDVNLISYD
jgi:hypothetical protein